MAKIIHILPHNIEDFMAGDYTNFDHHSVRFLVKVAKFWCENNGAVLEQELWVLSKRYDEIKEFKHEQGFKLRLFPISINLPLPLEISLPLLREVRKLKIEPNVVWHLHSYYLFMNDLLSWLLAFKKQKFVTHYRGGGPSWTLKACLYTIYHYLIGLRMSLSLAKYVFVQNHDEENRIVKFLRVKKDKVVYFPNSVSLKLIANIDLSKHVLDNSSFKIIMAGRVDKFISSAKKISVLKDMLSRNSNYFLEVVGLKNQDSTLEEMRKHFADRLKLIPWLNKAELLERFQQADLFLHLNTKEGFEGSPMALIEAQSQGLPVVAMDISGVRDVIQDGENGFLTEKLSEVPTKANLVFLSEDRSIFKKNAIKRIKGEFVDEKYFPKLIKIYQDLLGAEFVL